MKWLTPQQIPVPQSGNYPTIADFMLAYACYADLINAGLHFLAAKPDPQYANPQAYLDNMIAYAQYLTQNRFKKPYASDAWNTQAAAMTATFNCFATLSQIPVNAGDPDTKSVMEAWVSGKGGLFGGHDPIPAPGDGVNTATGQSAAPPGSIL